MIAWMVLNWKYMVIGVLVLALGSMFALYKVTVTELEAANTKLWACQDANGSMDKTLKELQSIQTSDQKTCDKRIKEKDLTIAYLQTNQNACKEAQSATPIPNTGDVILDRLNRMF